MLSIETTNGATLAEALLDPYALHRVLGDRIAPPVVEPGRPSGGSLSRNVVIPVPQNEWLPIFSTTPAFVARRRTMA